MTRRGAFQTLTAFIVGLFGASQAKANNSFKSFGIKLTSDSKTKLSSEDYKTITESLIMEPIRKAKETVTYIIHSSDVCAGEYPNQRSFTKNVTTSNPKVIEFLDSFLIEVYPGRMGGLVWKKSVRIEYAPGQYVKDKVKDVRMYYLSYSVLDKTGGYNCLVPFYTEHKEIIRVMDEGYHIWGPKILSQQDVDKINMSKDTRILGTFIPKQDAR